MNMLIEFLEEKRKKATFVGFIAALCALFMGVSFPDLPHAKTALAVIQLFWLVLLTLGLTSLFIDFIKLIWKKEKERSKKYDLPFNYIFSIALGYILASVIVSLWVYMLLLYTDVWATFLVSWGLPMGVAILSMMLIYMVEKNKDKFSLFSQALVFSSSFGLSVGLACMYVQFLLTKLYNFNWLTIGTAIVTIIVFTILVTVSIFRKQKLFS